MRGSSPLTRGKPLVSPSLRFRGRLIPAHAGKTDYGRVGHAGPPAHPRSRGENVHALGSAKSERGSSPLTRGKRARSCRRPSRLRLIPAHAGKTPIDRRPASVVVAHPRSRGENPTTRAARRCSTWLIPAHAGKTSRSRRSWTARTAHPRSRGENRRRRFRARGPWGSSPLTRGKRPPRTAYPVEVRLIPAHAGKTVAMAA